MVNENPDYTELMKLWEHCTRFVKEQRISCPEAVSQRDSVIENAYAFIEGISDIVGYDNNDEEE